MAKPEVYRSLGLKDEEYQKILGILGREPTPTELAMFSVEWSEHCGYPRSRNLLKNLPKKGKYQTIIGEDSGGIIVDDLAIIFKMESHNHPSQVEPYEGSKTGVGGIIRDIFTAGARPIASLNSLRFGPLNVGESKYLLKKVVEGIADYGNCLASNERVIIKNAGEVKDIQIGDYIDKILGNQSENVAYNPGRRIEIFSFDTVKILPCWKEVKKIFRRKINNLLRIKMTMGRSLDVTPDHPVLIYEQGKLKYKLANSLQIGDRIPIVKSLPEIPSRRHLDLIEIFKGTTDKKIFVKFRSDIKVHKGKLQKLLLNKIPSKYLRHYYIKNGCMPLSLYLLIEEELEISRREINLYSVGGGRPAYMPAIIEINRDFARLIGYYLAEGSATLHSNLSYLVEISFSKEEKTYIEDVYNLFKKYTNKATIRIRENTTIIRVYSWMLGSLLKDVLKCGSYSYSKEIPSIFFNQPREVKYGLLKGLFRGDGSVNFGKREEVVISFVSTSPKLFHQTLLLLQENGVFPSIVKVNRERSVFRNKFYSRRPYFQMRISNTNEINLLKDMFPSDIKTKINKIISGYNRVINTSHCRNHGAFSTVKVKKIERIQKNQYVYDFEVNDTHTFITSMGIITHNCLGVPTVAGEIYFDESYSGNCLVNAMSIGVANKDKLARARASGSGNAIMYVGSSTGRDGIGGCSVLASHEFKEGEEKRPTVQIGDPFTEKCLIEATLEALSTGHIVGIKDMGAAGLTCSTSEMASSGNCGVEIELQLVPRREADMQPWEIMMSESQERMLVCVKKGKEKEIERIFHKWDLNAVVIGKVTDDGIVRVKDKGKIVAEVKAHSLTQAPVYDMPAKKPDYLEKLKQLQINTIPQPQDYNEVLLRLLASPSIASKVWVYEQYDHMVQTNTISLPGSDASVLRLKGTNKALAATTDCNSRFCYLNPYQGAQIAVAEAARNLVCSGAEPAAITDCLNFGNPERPDRFWQFKNCVEGIVKACEFFNIAVVSGNVSFYNESPQGVVNPTPTIGMLGIIEDAKRVCSQYFKQEKEAVILLGTSKEELGGSEYLKEVHGQVSGDAPQLDLELEQAVQRTTLAAIRKGLVSSAHDCSEGGLAVALAECCISDKENKIGAVIDSLTFKARADAILFGESQSRIVLSCPAKFVNEIKALAAKFKAPFQIIGKTGGKELKILAGQKEMINLPVQRMSKEWTNSLQSLIMA